VCVAVCVVERVFKDGVGLLWPDACNTNNCYLSSAVLVHIALHICITHADRLTHLLLFTVNSPQLYVDIHDILTGNSFLIS
jgi:hypothetical protein